VAGFKALLAEARDALVGTLRGICDFVTEVADAARHAVRRDMRRSNEAGVHVWHRAAPLTRIDTSVEPPHSPLPATRFGNSTH